MIELKPIVIYTRVSSRKQVKDGHGCDSQESACRSYAKSMGWNVLRVFHEKGISGATDDRPVFEEMLCFLNHLEGDVVVLMDDVSRLARDHIKYGLLKQRIEKVAAKTAFVTMKFDETPEGNYVETIIAATAELERKQNARRTKSRMTARAKEGYYVSRAPVGYQYVKESFHGKILRKKEPEATYIKEALEGYASGHFETQYDVQAFLGRTLGKRYTYNAIRDILTRKVYAGFVDIPSLRVFNQGKHEPLISTTTYEHIQNRLKSRRNVIRTKHLTEFPLKSSVICNACGKRYTGSVSKGRSGYYAYYHCANRYCPERGKTTAKKLLEEQFVELLNEVRIRPSTFDSAYAMLDKLKESHVQNRRNEEVMRQKEIRKIEIQIQRGLDNLLECNEPRLVSRIRERLTLLEQRRLLLAKNDQSDDSITQKFRTVLNELRSILESPAEQWLQANEKEQRMLPKLLFSDGLRYVRNEGFRTARKSLPLKVLGKVEKGNLSMVGLSEIVLNHFRVSEPPNDFGE